MSWLSILDVEDWTLPEGLTCDVVVRPGDGRIEFTAECSRAYVDACRAAKRLLPNPDLTSISLCPRPTTPLDLKIGRGSVDVSDYRGDVVVHARNGNVKATNIIGNWVFRLESGKISISQSIGNLDVQSVRGDVCVTKSSGNLTVSCVDGNVRVADYVGNVVVQCVRGNVRTINVTGERRCETKSGKCTDAGSTEGVSVQTNVNGDNVSCQQS